MSTAPGIPFHYNILVKPVSVISTEGRDLWW